MKLPNMRPASVVATVSTALALAFAAGGATPASAAPVPICGSISNCATLTIVPSAADTGSARITSAPDGIDCTVTAGAPSGTCSAELRWPSTRASLDVVLTIAPSPGTVVCVLRSCAPAGVHDPITIALQPGETYSLDSLRFVQTTQTLVVARGGTGAGTVTSAPAAIDCGATCSATLDHDAQLALTATAAGGSAFAGWTGDCAGQGAACALTLSGDRATTAVFDAATAPPPPPATILLPLPPPLTPKPPTPFPRPRRREYRVFPRVTLARQARVSPTGGVVWLRVQSSPAADFRIVTGHLNLFSDEPARTHFPLDPARHARTTDGTLVLRIPPARRAALLAANRAELLGVRVTATASTGAAAQVVRSRIPIALRPLKVPRPLARRAVRTAGIQIRQASNDGGYEPLIATFRSAKCRRQGRGFVVDAVPPRRGFDFSVEIPSWRGYEATYPLIRRNDQLGVTVLVRTPGGRVYDSSVTVPGFPGAGGIVFAHDGSAISVGGTFFEQGDMNRGVTVAGAMTCAKRKKGKKR